MTTEKHCFSQFFDVKNPKKVRVTTPLRRMDDANPSFGQTHGEPPTTQGSFGCGGSRAPDGLHASVCGSEGTVGRSLLRVAGQPREGCC
jgi:hypothetical protein